MFRTLALLTAAATGGLAAVIERNWDVEWVNAAPDGFSRPVIGINGEWPCPTIEADVGDKIIVHLNNKLDNETTSLHWHGILQEGSTIMDGVSHTSQCPIPPGMSFTYEFDVNKPGTYWYHAHVGAQYSDGLRAPLIVHDKDDPYCDDIEAEYLLTVSDWYHDQTPTLLEELFDETNVQIRPPLPDAVLINDGKSLYYDIKPGKKYRFRVINMSAFSRAALNFDGHRLTIVESDGVYTEPAETEHLYVSAGQRYSVIVEGMAERDAGMNYGINVVLDMTPEVLTPIPTLQFPLNATAVMRYYESQPDPGHVTVDEFDILDDINLKPLYDGNCLPEPDRRIELNFNLGLDEEGIPRAYFNNVSYVHQNTPSLFTALTVGEDATDPVVYGQTNPFIINKDEVIEITLHNLSPGHHPFHLHGHHFQLLARSAFNTSLPEHIDEPAVPMKRDTVDVHGLSSAVIRFKADNPGVWLFHCHVEWHLPLGMVATFIEDPLGLQETVGAVPREHEKICKAQGMGTGGNAAGNRDDHYNFEGATSEKDVPREGALYNHRE